METNWFKDYFLEQTPEIEWQAGEVERACEMLAALSRANGGEILEDEAIDNEAKQAFAIARGTEALQKVLNEYARKIREQLPAFVYSQPKDEIEDAKGLTQIYTLVPKIDINRASFAELEALPGIGEVIAERIIEQRKVQGAFPNVEALQAIAGVGDALYAKFVDKVYVLPESYGGTFLTPALVSFAKAPSFLSYVAVLMESAGTFATDFDETATIQQRLLEGLNLMVQRVARDMFCPDRILSATKASEIEKCAQNSDRAIALRDQRITEKGMMGGLLFDSQYLYFVEDLLDRAQSSIEAILFFLKYEEERDYPTDRLIEALVTAHEHGVSVRVILDRDRHEDVFGSRLINQKAFDYFQKVGIEVIYDRPERATHTKLIVVDGQHVVLGSHNWTAGSLFAYDDTSIYISSSQLAQDYIDNFNRRYQALIADKD